MSVYLTEGRLSWATWTIWATVALKTKNRRISTQNKIRVKHNKCECGYKRIRTSFAVRSDLNFGNFDVASNSEQYQGFWIYLYFRIRHSIAHLIFDIVCWLVNPPIAKLDLFKSADCRWICKTYAEYSYRNSATVCRLVQSPTFQSQFFCGCPSDLRGKGIRVSPSC